MDITININFSFICCCLFVCMFVDAYFVVVFKNYLSLSICFVLLFVVVEGCC